MSTRRCGLRLRRYHDQCVAEVRLPADAVVHAVFQRRNDQSQGCSQDVLALRGRRQWSGAQARASPRGGWEPTDDRDPRQSGGGTLCVDDSRSRGHFASQVFIVVYFFHRGGGGYRAGRQVKRHRVTESACARSCLFFLRLGDKVTRTYDTLVMRW